MRALLALAAVASLGASCGDSIRPHFRAPRDRSAIRTDHALLAVDPTVSRALILVRAEVGALDGDAAFAVAHALDTVDRPDGWTGVEVRPRWTELMIEVPSAALDGAIDADARRFAQLTTAAPIPATTREQLVAHVAASRDLGIDRAIAHYAKLQVVVVGNFDPEATERHLARAFGDRAQPWVHSRVELRGRMGEAHDRQRDRVTVAYDAPEDALAEVCARLVVARLGDNARVDPPFTVELTHASSAEPVRAAIDALADAPDDEVARIAADVELAHAIALEGLAYRARMLAANAEPWSRAHVDAAAVRAWAAHNLRGPVVVVGDAP